MSYYRWNVLIYGSETKIGLRTFTTQSGKMSLQWLTTILNLRSDSSADLFLFLYLSSRKTPRWKSIVQRGLYFSLKKNCFFLSDNSGSLDHYICLFCSSVMHSLHKQYCEHSSQFSFWEIQIECLRKPDGAK